MPWFAAWSGDDLRRGLLPFDDGRVADVAEQLKVAAGDCSGGSLGLLVGRLMFVDLEIHRRLMCFASSGSAGSWLCHEACCDEHRVDKV